MAKAKLRDQSKKRKSKPPNQNGLSFTLILLILMLVVGCISGFIAYMFGKQALQGVNPVPTGVKIPKASPSPSDKPSPNSTDKPKKTSELFLLDEKQVIASVRQQINDELAQEFNSNKAIPVVARNADRVYKVQIVNDRLPKAKVRLPSQKLDSKAISVFSKNSDRDNTNKGTTAQLRSGDRQDRSSPKLLSSSFDSQNSKDTVLPAIAPNLSQNLTPEIKIVKPLDTAAQNASTVSPQNPQTDLNLYLNRKSVLH